MERRMSAYASGMVNDDIDLLYDLICRKYKKFKLFYRLVEELSESILSLKYDFSSDTSLYVSMTMVKGLNLKKVISDLEKKIDSTSSYTYNIVSEGKKVKISISTIEE